MLVMFTDHPVPKRRCNRSCNSAMSPKRRHWYECIRACQACSDEDGRGPSGSRTINHSLRSSMWCLSCSILPLDFTNRFSCMMMYHYHPSFENTFITLHYLTSMVFSKPTNHTVSSTCRYLKRIVVNPLWYSGNVAEAMRNIYSILRKAESIPEVQMILLPDLSGVNDELAPSVMDRIVRSTSGRLLQVPSHPVF